MAGTVSLGDVETLLSSVARLAFSRPNLTNLAFFLTVGLEIFKKLLTHSVLTEKQSFSFFTNFQELFFNF